MSEQRAIIYVTSDHLDQYVTRCADYVNRLGLTLAAVVVDDLGGGRWPEVAAMLLDGTVQVVVVADRDELPADRTPRVDVVAEQRRRLDLGQRSACRPRMVRGAR